MNLIYWCRNDFPKSACLTNAFGNSQWFVHPTDISWTSYEIALCVTQQKAKLGPVSLYQLWGVQWKFGHFTLCSIFTRFLKCSTSCLTIYCYRKTRQAYLFEELRSSSGQSSTRKPAIFCEGIRNRVSSNSDHSQHERKKETNKQQQIKTLSFLYSPKFA